MPHLALNINMSRMQVLVVGGGRIAERKIRTLLDTGAVVRVVAPQVTPEIAALSESGYISLRPDRYSSGDLSGVFLAVAATNDPDTNRTVAREAVSQNILVDVTDQPETGNCSFPALLRRGNLEIAVSTGGKCPAFASIIRDLIAQVVGTEYGTMLGLLAAEREKLLTEGSPSTYNTMILRSRARELIDEYIVSKETVP